MRTPSDTPPEKRTPSSGEDGDHVGLYPIGFVYLVTSLLSKHAFMNYYYLVYFALVAALVWSRVADVEDGAQLVNPTLHR